METQQISYLGAFMAGVLSFLSPCVLPLIPSYITYITGLSFSALDAEHPASDVRLKTFSIPWRSLSAFRLSLSCWGPPPH